MNTKWILNSLVALALSGALSQATPVVTAFTYQGRLMDNGSPANGLYDFQFSVMASPELGGPLDQRTANGVSVSNGLFPVTLDFGAELFDGSPRWLEIGVKTNNATGLYAVLSPRQELTATPYAILAGGLSGPLPDTGLSGTYGSSVFFSNAGNVFAGAFTGEGSHLLNVNAAMLEGLGAGNFWKVGGNADTSPDQFLGTLGNQPLELRVNNVRALRLMPTADAPNVIGGADDNVTGEGVTGATIGGGSHNSAAAIADTVGGGVRNHAGGGHSVVGGGEANTIAWMAEYGTISGGWGNWIQTNAYLATVGGGCNNVIQTNAWGATIAGGVNNLIENRACYPTISGGYLNKIAEDAHWAMIPGGWNNFAGGAFSFAAGHRAKAIHEGAFVWADARDLDYYSTRSNEFSIRAEGGVRIDSHLGIKLNDIDRPLITRGWFPFTNGMYKGVGRFGLFMEPWKLTAGLPTHGTAGFQVVSYNEDSTINTVLMSVNQSGVVSATYFNPTSDRAAKEHFEPVNPQAVLEQVASLPITRWNFKREAGTRHLGPMAQDFHVAFGLGADDKHIATMDADGVALAAIQGLNQKLTAELKRRDAEIGALKQTLSELKNLVQVLNSEANGGSQ